MFASSKNTCYLRGRRPCFSHRSHPGRLSPGGLMVEAMSKAFAVCWSHSPGGSFSGFPLNGFWRDGIVFVAKPIREKSRCKKRICDVPDHASLLANKRFPPRMFLDYSLLEVIRFVSLYQPSGCLLCSSDRVVSSGEVAHICVFSSIWNVIFVWRFLFLS